MIRPTLSELNFIENEEIKNISSLIYNDILKAIGCSSCVNNLQTFPNGSANDIVALSSSLLSYPSDTFVTNLKKLLYGINDLLPDLCVERPLKKTLISNVSNIILDKMGCNDHHEEIQLTFIDSTAHYAIITFCKTINDLLPNKTTELPNNFKEI